MGELLKTILHGRHVRLGAKMVEFGGWDMPVQYPTGIVEEHLLTRRRAGVFDVSHMGRFTFRGRDAMRLLQRALSNNAAALGVGEAQYTMIPNADGGAIDDAYLYRFVENEYLLVVNAANRLKDWEHLRSLAAGGGDVQTADRTTELAMISLQGPESRRIVEELLEAGSLPEPMRNALSTATVAGAKTLLARTGYTGEPLCFELFVATSDAERVWDALLEHRASPIGLGARDTLRLEAALPLYGHELGSDPDGREIPIFACPLARFAVSFAPDKGDFVGREALLRQYRAYAAIRAGQSGHGSKLPRVIMPMALTDKGVARAGAKVFSADGKTHVGYVTSGTAVPYWRFEGEGPAARPGDERGMRTITLAMVNSRFRAFDELKVDIRGRMASAVLVPNHMRSNAPPYARPAIYGERAARPVTIAATSTPARAADLVRKAIENTNWRQRECINLIPSEQTASQAARLLSICDSAGRYAEHKDVKALGGVEVFYYQGTAFIEEIERLLEAEFRSFLGCRQVETRVISGQMANAAVFSAMVDFINRNDRRREPRRIRSVLNNHIIRGGHLSAQPMGALRDFVATDPHMERPAVTPFPVEHGNPYRIDVAACRRVLEEQKPELIIFGKSMVLHPEPVSEIRAMVDEMGLDAVIMYDMAHVLGLVGPHFQRPFDDGADIVTGSTHKTFFGTQRGVIGCNFRRGQERFKLWRAVQRRTFPGSVSNHHLGTMLGLLMAAYEMNHFKDAYQRQVLANAKAFASALKRCGLDVAGDPAVGYTQTHQVVVHVGYATATETAQRLEQNNIIVNYQAAPTEEGFTAAGALRLGVAEMTRFGMKETDLQAVAELLADVVIHGRQVKDKVVELRRRFVELQFCFHDKEFDAVVSRLHKLV